MALHGDGGGTGGGAGSRSLILEIPADSSTTTFTFNSIPATYNGLVVESNLGDSNSAGTLAIKVNNDGSAIYQLQRNGSAGAGSLTSQQLLATSWVLTVGLTVAARFDLQFRMLNYALTGAKRIAYADMAFGNSTTGALNAADFALLWDSTTVVSRLDFIFGVAPTVGKIRLFGLN